MTKLLNTIRDMKISKLFRPLITFTMDKEKSLFSSMHISTKTILLCTSLFVANIVELSREFKRLKKLKKEQDANV
jgi:hypothetical protein